jgi:ADP-ribose pyrophosphatase
VEPWRVLSSRVAVENRWLRVREDRCETAHGAVIESYHVVECDDGINVVALTRAGRLLLTREYRHGAGAVLFGIPAGIVDPGDASPAEAARRELLEETGYGGGEFVPLLTYWANPARQNNRVTSFLATGVERLAAPNLDPAEAIEVAETDLQQTLDRMQRGELVMAATHVAALWAAAALLGMERRGR